MMTHLPIPFRTIVVEKFKFQRGAEWRVKYARTLISYWNSLYVSFIFVSFRRGTRRVPQLNR